MKQQHFKHLLFSIVTLLFTYLTLFVGIQTGFINTYWQGILIVSGIHIILAVSLNITSGFLGSLALGHAGFMAIGAYGAAFFSKNMALTPSVELLIACLLGGLLAMIFGWIVCLPTLRLRGDYLAIITLAFGEIVRNVLNNMRFLGGASGYSGIAKYTQFHSVFWWMSVAILLTLSFLYSRQGRNVLAIREDEIAAESTGVSLRRYKILSFLLSAFLAGIAGALYAHYMGFLQPSIFSLEKSIEILVMVVLGGMGNIGGAILAAIVLTVLPELLRSVSQYRMLVYSVVLILIMLTRNKVSFPSFYSRKKKELNHE